MEELITYIASLDYTQPAPCIAMVIVGIAIAYDIQGIYKLFRRR